MEATPVDIDLLVGRSTVLNVGSTIARVSLTVPDIADAMVTAPTQLLIHGKQPGTISLFVWDKAGSIKTYEVKVRRDLSSLIAHLKQLFPSESITVLGSGKDVVLSGTVSGQYVVDKAAEVAGGYVDKKENVVNLLKQQEGVASNQVMLRVRFAEVTRNALTELGASFFAHARADKWFGRTTTDQFGGPEWDEDGKLVFSDFLNLFVFNTKAGLGGVVRALQEKGLFQSLAEPNLIATNGKEASFLAGGEFPIPVVQSGQGGNSITVQFKEFGIRLHFTPTVLGGDLINLKVKPEVSALDFANAVVIDGFRIPALSTRRTETEVELRDGQTFAIAGLMNNTLTNAMSKIPGIGDIPILGLLFKSKAAQKAQTELVVMITPTIVKRGQMGVSEGLPSLVEPYLEAPKKTHPNPDAYVGSPRYPVNQPARKPGANDNNAPAPSPQAAARPAQPAPKASEAPAKATEAPAKATEAPATFEPAARPVAAVPSPQAAPAQEPSSEAVMTPITPAQMKAIERAREQERREAELRAAEERRLADAAARQKASDDKKKAEEARVAAKKAEEDRRMADKAAKDREKSLTDAAARLKEAQAAYQAEIDKAKTATPEKKGGTQ
jgi:pilus assembly protein CpaC